MMMMIKVKDDDDDAIDEHDDGNDDNGDGRGGGEVRNSHITPTSRPTRRDCKGRDAAWHDKRRSGGQGGNELAT